MKCPNCQSEERVKNGIVNSKQRYRCKKCKYNFRQEWKGKVHPTIKQLCILLYINGLGFRRIADIFGIHHSSVQSWWRKLGERCGKHTQKSMLMTDKSQIDKVEIDELWHWCIKKNVEYGYGLLWIERMGNHRLDIGFSWAKIP